MTKSAPNFTLNDVYALLRLFSQHLPTTNEQKIGSCTSKFYLISAQIYPMNQFRMELSKHLCIIEDSFSHITSLRPKNLERILPDSLNTLLNLQKSKLSLVSFNKKA